MPQWFPREAASCRAAPGDACNGIIRTLSRGTVPGSGGEQQMIPAAQGSALIGGQNSGSRCSRPLLTRHLKPRTRLEVVSSQKGEAFAESSCKADINSGLLSCSLSVTSYRWQIFSARSHQFGCGTACLVRRDGAGLEEPGSALRRARGPCPVTLAQHCPLGEKRAFGPLIFTLPAVLFGKSLTELTVGFL